MHTQATPPRKYAVEAHNDFHNYREVLKRAALLTLNHINDVYHTLYLNSNERHLTEPWREMNPMRYRSLAAKEAREWWWWDEHFEASEHRPVVVRFYAAQNYPDFGFEDFLFYRLRGLQLEAFTYEAFVCMPYIPGMGNLYGVSLFPATDGYWYERTATGFLRTFL